MRRVARPASQPATGGAATPEQKAPAGGVAGSGGAGAGVANQQQRAPQSAERAAQEQAARRLTEDIAKDVLEQSLRPNQEQKRATYAEGAALAASNTADQVTLQGKTLRVAGKKYELDETLAKSMTLLPPNARVISQLAASEGSQKAQLVVAAPGSGVSHSVRFGLTAMGRPFEYVRLTKASSIDKLVGSTRADNTGKIVTTDGPLTAAIRNGGTVVIDGADRADAEINALLLALANGLDVFQHPMSGEPIPVSKDLRLVIIADSDRVDARLVRACPGHQRIPAYDADEHAKLLQAQVGLSPSLSRTLADFHQALLEKVASLDDGGRIDFGNDFPLAWPLLQRVGKRLANEFTPSRAKIANALYAVYGARLDDKPNDATAFQALLAEFDYADEPVPGITARKDSSLIHTPQVERTISLCESALEAGETVHVRGPRQSGVTAIVGELAARRNQKLVTIIGHPGTDDASLRELPRFREDGTLYYQQGRVTNALLNGDLLYVDQADYLTPERQNAFFAMLKEGKVLVQDDTGALVEKAIHPNARVVLSTCDTSDRGRQPPIGVDRALATEVVHPGPTIDELEAYLPATAATTEVGQLVLETAKRLHEEDDSINVTRLQKFLDFANAAQLLSRLMSPEQAVRVAAEKVFEAGKTATVRALPQPPKEPLWPQIMGVDIDDIKEKCAKKNLRIVDSLNDHLDTFAIASALGRSVYSVYAVGPASSGKTVAGSVWATIVDGQTMRFQNSASTEAREKKGGIAPVQVKGKTRFVQVDGAEADFARQKDGVKVFIDDEIGLSREAQLALKPLIDARGTAIDAEGDKDVVAEGGLWLFTDNPVTYAGRAGLLGAIRDAAFTVYMDARPAEESKEIVLAGCGLEPELVAPVVSFFADLGNQKTLKLLDSTAAPFACTERDMLKAARTAEHLFKRDGITDPDERRRILGREVFRLISQSLESRDQIDVVYDKLIGKHFGKAEGAMRVNDVPRPERPSGFSVVEKNGQKYLKLGVAEYPIRPKGTGHGVPPEVFEAWGFSATDSDKPTPPTAAELDAMVPNETRDLIGPQLESAEAVMLALETGTAPPALVGVTGSGKTVLGRILASKLNMPLWEQPYFKGMTTGNIFGDITVTEDNKVEMIWTPLVSSLMWGGLYVGDEFLTLPNEVREALNAVTEGSEIKIPSRPPITLPRSMWNERALLLFLTNGGDVRKATFSPAEASRLRATVFRELETKDDYLTMAKAAHGDFAEAAVTLSAKQLTKLNKTDALERLVAFTAEKAPAANAALLELGAKKKNVEIPDLGLSPISLTQDELVTLAGALKSLGHAFDTARGQIINQVIEAVADDDQRMALMRVLPIEMLGVTAAQQLGATAVRDGRFTDEGLLEKSAQLFCQLRDLQKSSKNATASPLTPRPFGKFLDLFARVLEVRPLSDAAATAARLALVPCFGDNDKVKKKALELVADMFGAASERDITPPAQTAQGLRISDTVLEYGELQRVRPNSSRFPFTPQRLKDFAEISDAIAYGQGLPVYLPEDDNDESLAQLREMGRLTGTPVTVVNLPPDADIERMIQSLSLKTDPNTGDTRFMPELEAIGRAAAEGHYLVLKGCGNVESDQLERLNELLDGRRELKLPRTQTVLKANPHGRVFLMRRSDGNDFSVALYNRLLEPQVAARDTALTSESLMQRAQELGAIVAERTKVDQGLCNKLAVLHQLLNRSLRDLFTVGASLGSFKTRDAEAVARRYAWLKSRNVVTDPAEGMYTAALEVYGARMRTEQDFESLKDFARTAFGSTGVGVELPQGIASSPTLMRLGPWVVSRDVRGPDRAGVPGIEADLPIRESRTLLDTHQKTFAAYQFDEPVHLDGDEFVASATLKNVARLTSSAVIEVEANKDLTREYLFGGVIQKKDGTFENYDGLVWKAQSEGATLVIRRASQIPPEVLPLVAEMVSSGTIERRRDDGSRDIQPLKARVVFQTGSDDDKPLAPELASLATRVPCPPIDNAKEQQKVLSHLLLGTVGGPIVASELIRLNAAAAKALAGEPNLLRGFAIDSARMFSAAQDIGRRLRLGEKPEQVFAAVLNEYYALPTKGLGCEVKVRELVDQFFTNLEQVSGGVLVSTEPDTVDFVKKPLVATLKDDFNFVAPSLTGALGNCLGSFLGRAEVEPERRLDALKGALEAGILPQSVQTQAEEVVAKMAGGAQGTQLLLSLGKALRAEAAPGEGLNDLLLDFVRGSVVWDIEARFDILSRYRSAFERLVEQGSESASDIVASIDDVTDRLGAVGALEKVSGLRQRVTNAIDRYSRSARTPEIQELLKNLEEQWDLVGTSPLFKEDFTLRNELTKFSALSLDVKERAADAGTDAEATQELVGALTRAAEIIEGIRVAEQSTQLRRGLEDSLRTTDDLVGQLSKNVTRLQELKLEQQRKARLDECEEVITTQLAASEFLSLGDSDFAFKKAAAVTDEDVMKLAREEAQPAVEEQLRAERLALAQTLEVTQASSPADLLKGQTAKSGDLGVRINRIAADAAPLKAQADYAEKLGTIDDSFDERVELLARKNAPKVRARLEAKAAKEFQERVSAAGGRAATRVARSANEVRAGIELLVEQLDLEKKEPALAAELEATTEQLSEAAKRALDWGEQFKRTVESIAEAAFDVLTFGLFSKKKSTQASNPQLDLDDARHATQQSVAKLNAYIAEQRRTLPDFGEIERCSTSNDNIASRLVDARNLGDLAARFVQLQTIAKAQDNGPLRNSLLKLVNNIGADKDREAVLFQVNGFLDSVDALTSELAGQQGLPSQMAPVLEVVVRAAESVRNQSVTDYDFRSARAKLEQAVAALDELGASIGGLPPALDAVKGEIDSLTATLGSAQERGGAVNIKTDGVADLIQSLVDKAEASGGGPTVLDEATQLTPQRVFGTRRRGDVARLDTVRERLARAKVPVEPVKNRVVRQTQLKYINIDFSVARKLFELKLPDVEKPVEEKRAEALVAAQRLTQSTEGTRDRVLAQQERALKALTLLDLALGKKSLEQVDGQLAEVGATLQKLAVASGGDYRGRRTDVALAIEQLEGISEVVRSLEFVDRDVGAKLQGQLDAAALLLSRGDAQINVTDIAMWASETLERTVEVKEQLKSSAPKKPYTPSPIKGKKGDDDKEQRVKREEPIDVAKALAELTEATTELAGQRDKLGAWARASALAHIGQRLTAVKPALDADRNSERAELCRTTALTEAKAQYELSDGAGGDAAMTQLYEAAIDLAASVVKTEEPSPEAIEATNRVLDGTFALFATDIPGRSNVQSLAQSIDAALSEVAKSGGEFSEKALLEAQGAVATLSGAARRSDLESVAQQAAVRADAYLAQFAEAQTRLTTLGEAFLTYDPTTSEGTIDDAVNRLVEGLSDALTVQGPARFGMAAEIGLLEEKLNEVIDAGGTERVQAQQVLTEARDAFDEALALTRLAATPPLELYASLVDKLVSLPENTDDASLTEKLLTDAERSGTGLAAVEMADPAETLAQLKALGNNGARVANDQPTPAEIDRTQAPVSQVRELMKSGAIALSPSTVVGAKTANGAGGTAAEVANVAPGAKIVALGNADGLSAGGAATGVGIGGGSVGGLLDGGVGSGVQPYGRGATPGADKAIPSGVGDGVVQLDAGVGSPGYQRGATLDGIESRPDLPTDGEVTDDAKVKIVSLSRDDISSVQKQLNERIKADLEAREVRAERGVLPLNDFQQLVADNPKEAAAIATVLRSLPDTEVVFLSDISGSTASGYGPEGVAICDQEAAFVGLGMAGVQLGESNCAVAVFNSRASLVKPMQAELSDDVANQAYLACAQSGGGTTITGGLDLAAGQFSSSANNKLIVLCTDAQVGNPYDVQQKIAQLRAQGIGVALIGFGAAQNVQACGGQWSCAVNGLEDAIEKAADFIPRCLEENNGRFRGEADSAASGIGVSVSQSPLQAAEVDGLGATADILVPAASDDPPAQVLAGKGDSRDLYNLADRQKYDVAAKQLRRNQQRAESTADYRKALELGRKLRAKLEKDGVIESLRKTFETELPIEGGLQWVGRQPQGPRLDPDAIPEYVVGLEQGNPSVRIFQNRRPTGASDLTVVLEMDESTSMNADKFNQNLEGLIATALAIKAFRDDAKIAVVGMSDEVRLHHPFAPFDDASIAHLLMSLKNEYSATDNERGHAEAVELASMMGGENSAIFSFSDGQGMPGARGWMEEASKRGILSLTVGIGSQCAAVSSFDEHGLAVGNLGTMARKMGRALSALNQKRGKS